MQLGFTKGDIRAAEVVAQDKFPSISKRTIKRLYAQLPSACHLSQDLVEWRIELSAVVHHFTKWPSKCRLGKVAPL